MKRIIFLVIASLLVIGLVLPGCTLTPYIIIAVCGPHLQCQDMMLDGARMAADEINAENGGKGILIGNAYCKIDLVSVETNECAESETGTTGTANLDLAIKRDRVNFCVGGVRPEVVAVYREVAMDAHKIFMDCCAATSDLQMSVVNSYNRYKYWFKASPLNEVFLFTSLFKMTATIGGILQSILSGLEAANPPDVKDAYKVGTTPPLTPLRVEILADDAACCCCGAGWYQGIVAAAQNELPLLGFNVTGTTVVDSAALVIPWAPIAANNPHIIFTAFCGPAGKVYSKARYDMDLTALSIGINVEGQSQSMVDYTGGGCEGEIMLDTWAAGLYNTDKTAAWLNKFIGSYPVCCVAAYDAIKQVVAGMQALGSITSTDALIAYMETHPYTGVAGTTAYYQMWDGTTKGDYKAGTPDEESDVPALNQAQVLALYPWLQGLHIKEYGQPATTWSYNADDWTTSGGFIAHDLVYGPGYQTGIGAQWQDVGGMFKKVGVWPKVIPGLEALAGLPPNLIPPAYQEELWEAKVLDQYGNWNFRYPGTASLILPIGGMLTIGWNPYTHAV